MKRIFTDMKLRNEPNGVSKKRQVHDASISDSFPYQCLIRVSSVATHFLMKSKIAKRTHALSAPVQGSRFKVGMKTKVPNEPILERSRGGNLKSKKGIRCPNANNLQKRFKHSSLQPFY